MPRPGAAYTAERSEQCRLWLHYSAGDDSSAAMRGLSVVALTDTVSLKPGRVPLPLYPPAEHGAKVVSVNKREVLSISIHDILRHRDCDYEQQLTAQSQDLTTDQSSRPIQRALNIRYSEDNSV